MRGEARRFACPDSREVHGTLIRKRLDLKEQFLIIQPKGGCFGVDGGKQLNPFQGPTRRPDPLGPYFPSVSSLAFGCVLSGLILWAKQGWGCVHGARFFVSGQAQGIGHRR